MKPNPEVGQVWTRPSGASCTVLWESDNYVLVQSHYVRPQLWTSGDFRSTYDPPRTYAPYQRYHHRNGEVMVMLLERLPNLWKVWCSRPQGNGYLTCWSEIDLDALEPITDDH